MNEDYEESKPVLERAKAIARCYLDAPEYSEEEQLLHDALNRVCEEAELHPEDVTEMVWSRPKEAT
jgi:hypothetical protein